MRVRGIEIALFGLLVGIGVVPPVASLPQENPAEILSTARKLYSEQGPRAALPQFERALALFGEADDRRNVAITLGYIGNCYKRLGEFSRSLEYHHRALKMKQELGDRLEEGKTVSNLGLVYWEMGEYARAIEHFTRSIAIARELGDRALEGASLNNLSLVFDEQGEYRRSLEQYYQALELHRAVNSLEREGATLGNIGGVHLLLGQFREAMGYYQQSLAISERLNLKPSASQDLGNLALCHLGLGQVREALQSFDRALALAREAGLKKEEADWIRGRGSVLLRMGKYESALYEYRRALGIYRQAGLKRELVEALNDQGTLSAVLGDVPSAEAAFREAVELARSIGNPRGVVFNLIALGGLEWRQSRFEQAAALYHEALTLAREAGDQTSTALSLLQLAFLHRDRGQAAAAGENAAQALEIARKTGARALEAQALLALAEAGRISADYGVAFPLYVDGQRIADSLEDPDLVWRLAYGYGQALEASQQDPQALMQYHRAVAAIESVRAQLRQERFRAGYIEDKYQVYVTLVRLLLKMGRIEEAFQTAERLRARNFVDLLRRGEPLARSDAQREAEAALRERIRLLQRALEQENIKPPPEQRGQAIELFSRELREAERAFQNLLDELRASEPEYAAAGALEVPSTDRMQQRLGPQEVLVEYLVDGDSLVIFLVAAQRLHALTVPVRSEDLAGRVELLRDLIVRQEGSDWKRPAQSLRRLLIGSLEDEGWLEGIRRLYLVPHGILHYVPFAALLRTENDRDRFLVSDYELAFLPAASVLTRAPATAAPAGKLLALAPARTRLPYAQLEVRSIARNYSRDSYVLVGKQATESAFKRVAGRYQLIHLATHGYFNKWNPLLSGVELEAGGEEDGRLEVHEILGMRLNAELVTLSACDTALGSGYFTEVPPGDDLVGLTRAFLFAGSPSVLATLWQVSDRSTLELMHNLYEELPRSNKAAALARAQRTMAEGKGRLAHPYFWASFILVGKMD